VPFEKTIFFVRLDRLGDLVLTLPSQSRVPEGWKTLWLIPENLSFVAEASDPKPDYVTVSKNFSWESFSKLYSLVRKTKPQGSLIFHGPWWIYLLFFLARVPLRGAPLSKWYSFLFCNRGLRQKRSVSRQHESQYNYDLVDHFFETSAHKPNDTFLRMKASRPASDLKLPSEYVVVHPGMGGSALNWPSKKYIELINHLLEENCHVVITGTKNDDLYLSPIRKAFVNFISSSDSQIFWMDGKLSGSQLIDVLGGAQQVVAPSTGVIHLAASLGVSTTGIYSPITVHRPMRWGPRGLKTSTVVPKVDCPEQFSCLGSKCSHFPCMDKLQVKDILEARSRP